MYIVYEQVCVWERYVDMYMATYSTHAHVYTRITGYNSAYIANMTSGKGRSREVNYLVCVCRMYIIYMSITSL